MKVPAESSGFTFCLGHSHNCIQLGMFSGKRLFLCLERRTHWLGLRGKCCHPSVHECSRISLGVAFVPFHCVRFLCHPLNCPSIMADCPHSLPQHHLVSFLPDPPDHPSLHPTQKIYYFSTSQRDLCPSSAKSLPLCLSFLALWVISGLSFI